MIEHSIYCPHCNTQDFLILDINKPVHDIIHICELCDNIVEMHLDFNVVHELAQPQLV